MQQDNQLLQFKVQFHSKKQLAKMALWDSTFSISQWPPDQIFTVYSILFLFSPNCQTCKQKPGFESQAVCFLAYTLPAAIKRKNLEVKFCPKLHLCNHRDLEHLF